MARSFRVSKVRTLRWVRMGRGRMPRCSLMPDKARRYRVAELVVPLTHLGQLVQIVRVARHCANTFSAPSRYC